jgi:maleylpyruvate isomerase
MMQLYTYWRSSSAWRVRIALAYKGVPFEAIPVHLVRDGGQHLLPEFRALNPMAQVPVLIDAGADHERGVAAATAARRLTQSMAILEFLEETHPEPPLLPRDPWARGRARQLAEMVNSGIQPLQNMALQRLLKSHGIEPAPVARDFIATGLAALEAEAAAAPGAFLVGDTVTFADVLLIPQLYNARRYQVDVSAFPTLLRVEARCAALPAFAAAHPDAQPDREEVPAAP